MWDGIIKTKFHICAFVSQVENFVGNFVGELMEDSLQTFGNRYVYEVKDGFDL